MNKKHEKAYVDEQGYWRDVYGNLIHRQVAKRNYLSNRNKYKLPFAKYVVHHKNEDKKDNRIENLEILTPEEHRKRHGKPEKKKKRKWWKILFTILVILLILNWIISYN